MFITKGTSYVEFNWAKNAQQDTADSDSRENTRFLYLPLY